MPRGEFRFTGQKCHLTYKTHIDFEAIKEMLNKYAGGPRALSMVHELGDEQEEAATPYEHTHVAVYFKQKPDIADARCFDIGEIHPNMQVQRSMKWFRHLIETYHKGNKTKADGKKYFIKPIKLEQIGCDKFLTDEELLNTITRAPTLLEACLETGIMPKSVSDVLLIRNNNKRKIEAEPESCVDIKRFKQFDFDKAKALVLKGTANCGKTNWALSQFKKPLLICELDQLKEITQDTDGLVFDEMLFGHHPKQSMIYLLDMAFDRVIRTRHSNAIIPKGLARIFTCNEHEWVFGEYPHESVKRRYNEIKIETKMYD